MPKKYLYFLAAGHMSVDLTAGALPAILPFLMIHRGMTYTEVSGLIFASALLSSLLQPVFGYLADKIAQRWFMGAGIILAGVSLAVIGFVDDYWTVFFAVSVMGLGSSMFHPEAARLITSISGAHKGEGMAIFSVGGNAGFGVAPILAVAAMSLFGLKGLIIFGVICFGVGFATLIIVPKIAKLADRKISPAKISSTKGGASNDWKAFRKLTVVLAGRSIIFNGIMVFLPLYCIYHLTVSEAVGSSILSVYAVVGIFMTILGGKLADHFDLISVIRVCTVCYVPTLALIITAPSFALIVALILPLAVATHGSYSPFVVLGQTYLSKSIGFASGVTLGLSTSLGGVVAPAIGVFADNFGIESAMYLLLLIGLICTISAFMLPKSKNKI